MTFEEKLRYWNPVRDKYFRRNSKGMDSFFGVNEWLYFYEQPRTPMDEKLRQTLQMLAGPYGDVFLEVLKKQRLEQSVHT